MASRSERSRKAAETRLENVERERRENERLAKETAGGRAAKTAALRNAVWKGTSTKKPSTSKRSKRYGDESEGAAIDVDRRQTTKHVRKQGESDLGNDGNDGNDDNDNDNDNNGDSDVAQEKGGRRNKVLRQSLNKGNRDAGSDADSDAQEEDTDGDTSESNSSSEDDEPADLGDESPYFVQPTVNKAGLSDLDEDLPTKPVGRHNRSTAASPRPSRGSASPLPASRRASPPTVSPPPASRRASPPTASSPPGSRRASPPAASPPPGSRRASARNASPLPAPAQHRKRTRRVADSSDEENIPPTRPSPAKRTKSNKSRKENFMSERPRISAGKSRKEKTTSSRSSQYDPTQWSAEVQIKPTVVASDKKRKLMEQTFVIQAIVRHAIEKATEEILLRNNWPEETNRNTFGQTLLLNACQEADIKDTYEDIKEVKKRMKVDPVFTKGLCDLVVDRLSGVRAPAKSQAANQLPLFNLGLGESCKKRVASVLQDYRYHMNGTWGGETGNEWQPDTKSSFTSRALIDTIREAYFSSPRAIGYRYIDQFSSSIPDKPDEKEMPISLIALGLTGLYCCISEFEGGKKKDLAFEATRFLPTNRSFMKILSKLQEDRPVQAHKRFHKILNLVIGESAIGSIEDIENGAYNIIDF